MKLFSREPISQRQKICDTWEDVDLCLVVLSQIM